MRNTVVDDRGQIWTAHKPALAGQGGGLGGQPQGWGAPALQQVEEHEAGGSWLGIREILQLRAEQAAVRRKADAAAARAAIKAAAKAAAAASLAAPDAPQGQLIAAAVAPSSSIDRMAQTIRERRARQATQHALYCMVAEEVAAVRERHGLPPPGQAPLVPLLQRPRWQPRGRRHARPRGVQHAAAAAAAAHGGGSGAALAVDEGSVLALAAAILHGPGSEEAAAAASGAVQLLAHSPGTYLRVQPDLITGHTYLSLTYDPDLVVSWMREFEYTVLAVAAASLGQPFPVSRLSWLPPEVIEAYWLGKGFSDGDAAALALAARRPRRRVLEDAPLEDLESAILAGVEIPSQHRGSAPLAVLPEDPSLPDQIAAVEGGAQLACDTLGSGEGEDAGGEQEAAEGAAAAATAVTAAAAREGLQPGPELGAAAEEQEPAGGHCCVGCGRWEGAASLACCR